MDVLEIQRLLPHRFPFLLVDRVIELRPGERLVAYKNVTIGEPFFAGHFPGHPVMPGVLVLEALAQASAILCYSSTGFDPKKKVTVLRLKSSVVKSRGVATVDGQVAAEGEFMATVVDKDALKK